MQVKRLHSLMWDARAACQKNAYRHGARAFYVACSKGLLSLLAKGSLDFLQNGITVTPVLHSDIFCPKRQMFMLLSFSKKKIFRSKNYARTCTGCSTAVRSIGQRLQEAHLNHKHTNLLQRYTFFCRDHSDTSHLGRYGFHA